MNVDGLVPEGRISKVSRLSRFLKVGGILLALIITAAGTWFWLNQAPPPNHADVAYGSASEAQRLDIYLPEGKGPFPVVIFAHGGAFQFGSKREFFPGFKKNIEQMRSAGIAMVSIDYRMAGETTFPAAVQDMKSAVRFLRANGARYRIDPDKIAVWGKSAGAHLALMTGLTSKVAMFDDPAATAPAVSDRVSAIVSMYGPTDFLQMDAQLKVAGCAAGDQDHSQADSPESKYLGGQITKRPEVVTQSNPITYVRANSPPLMLLHGSADCTVPPLQSTILRDAAAKVMPPDRLKFAILPDATHGDSAFESDAQMAEVIAFLNAGFAQSDK
jgi:acetyl esterase/lipase